MPETLYESRRRTAVTVALDPVVHREFRKLAAAEGMPMAELNRRLIGDYVCQHRDQETASRPRNHAKSK
jgi:hypothetical protein